MRAVPLTAHACAALLALAACTVGPDFREPDATASPGYVAGTTPATIGTGATEQRFAGVDDIRADWWALFASPRLDARVAEALAASPTLAEARARLVAAEQTRNAGASAAAWPSANLRAGLERQRIDPAVLGFPQAPNPGPFNLVDVGVDVGYAFDVFGGTRRSLEGLAADVDFARYELEAAQRTLAANLVTAALHEASLTAQRDALAKIVAARRDTLAIAQKRYALGAIAEVDLASQRASLADAEARIPPIDAELARTAHRLAVYTGREPAQWREPPFTLAEFALPPQLPLTLPSTLAARRPDIRASEALLHRASADVGVATAALYPQFSFSGNASSTRSSLADIARGINIWSIGLDLVQPLLRGPELEARQRAAIAAFDAAKAAYRASVLHGLQQVADAIRALEADAREEAARGDAEAAAARARDITQKRYALGGVGELERLDAERTHLDAVLARTEATAARYADTAALVDALGGGWWPGALVMPANAGIQR
jgi:NodT family efflux transporter outer membrane factor (OMF) lipoprotein